MTISFFEMYEKNKDYHNDYDNVRYNSNDLTDLYFKYVDIAFAEDETGFCRKFSRLVQEIFTRNDSHKFPEEVYLDCIKRSIGNGWSSIQASIQWGCVNNDHCPQSAYKYISENREKYESGTYNLAVGKLVFLNES